MPKVIKNLIDRVRLLFCKDKESYSVFYSILGFVPNDITLYRTALTHSSMKKSKQRIYCNERLEFLGDAVLSSIISDFLYFKFSHEREGFLSKSRSNLVCRERLNQLAVRLGFDKLIDTGVIEYKHNNYLYGNAFEAFIGAIYIDKGYEYCRTFILERVLPELGDVDVVLKSDNNYKSRLIEWGQKKKRSVVFDLLSEEQRIDGYYFISSVSIDGEICGRGEGFSKRESQQRAACEAIKTIPTFDEDMIRKTGVK